MSNLLEMIRKKRQEIQQNSGRREKTVKPRQGKSKWRVLPGWRKDGDPQFYREFGQSFVKNAEGEVVAVVPSKEIIYGSSDEFQDFLRENIIACRDDDLIKKLKDMIAKPRFLVNALDLDGEDPNTPVILELTPTTFEKVLEIMEEYDPEGFLSLEKGIDLVITRSGKGLNTEYSVMPAAKSTPVAKAVMAKLNDLDEYVNQEFENASKKAMIAIGQLMGKRPALASTATKALTGPKQDDDDSMSEVLDDEIPSKAVSSTKVIEGEVLPPETPAEPEAAPAKADEAAVTAESAEDIEALLKDLDL